LEKFNNVKVVSVILMLFLMLSMFGSLAFSKMVTLKDGSTSAGADDESKVLSTGSIGMDIMDDNITLTGVMMDDLLEPTDYTPSGFPWSQEEVSFTITKYGEIPQFSTTYEHIMSGYPVQGWILEVDFQNGAGQGGNYTRYWWAQFSKPGGMFGQWRSTDVETLNGTEIVPQAFRLVVNTTRLAVVKVDLALRMKDRLGLTRDWTNGFIFTINYTYVFFKDKKYIVEYKNIYTKVEKWIADTMEVQFMQDVEFDVDWGEDGNYMTDASFYSVAPKNASYDGWQYQLGMQYWPYNYSLVVVEPEEAQVSDYDHTGYMAFYPNLSNWDVRFFEESGDPYDADDGGNPASNNYRIEKLRQASNLVMGAWNFTLLGDGAENDYHLAVVLGAAEGHWDSDDNCIPDSGVPGYGGASLFEIAWALNETFSPHYKLNYIGEYDWWPFAGNGVPDEKYMGSGAPSSWPWWDGQKGTYMDGIKENLAMFVVGDTLISSPWDQVKSYGALTWDNLAAIDVAQSYGVALGDSADEKEPWYRSALDSDVSVFSNGFIGLHRWAHESSYQVPTQVSSHIDYCDDPTTTPYKDTSLPWKTNVWHTFTFGGPDVNVVTNYFNDFGFVYYVGAWPTAVANDLPGDSMTPDVIYVPGSKRVYYDYKVDNECHYFARVSLVMDMNITAEGSPTDLYPWAGMIIDGLRAEGTAAAGSFVAHTWDYWSDWDLFQTMDDGAVGLVLEFIDETQDGHIDEMRVVEVIGTVVTSLTELPDIDWDVK
jgi:hypothetical protein